MNRISFVLSICVLLTACPNHAFAQRQLSNKQRANLLKRFPAADRDKDGKLSNAEIQAFTKRMRGGGGGIQRNFKVDPGWKLERFPDHAACYKSPAELKELFSKSLKAKPPQARTKVVTSYEKPTDGSLRIVGTGHSFMAPGYKTFPIIARMSGLKQPQPLTHTGGGMTGSARYIWEHENGIFQFDGQPLPKLLASIANAKWDAMMWGPYYNDQPEYYACWIDFCLKYNPEMKFFIADAWPQLEQFQRKPKSEDDLTYKAIAKLGTERNTATAKIVGELNRRYPNKVFVMPTSDAMVLAVREYHEGNLPGIEGIHKAVGGKERSLWRDQLGHLGPGLDALEGYVFYATLYGKSPEAIEAPMTGPAKTPFPGPELDKVFRKIAWEAVSNHPLSGVKNHSTVPGR
jgi:hypothetical protein